MNDQQEHLYGEDPGHEPFSISIRAVIFSVIGLVVLVAFTMLAMGPLSRVLTPGETADEVETFVDLPVEAPQRTVGLNPDQARDRLLLEERQRMWLGEYAWLDDDQQVARIPIGRAMELIEERGLAVVVEGEIAPAEAQRQQGGEEEESP